MKRKDIMTQLVEDLQNNLHPGNGYKTQPNKIYRGYYQWDDISQTPALAVTLVSDDLVDNFQQVFVVLKPHLRQFQAAFALDVDLIVAVNQNI